MEERFVDAFKPVSGHILATKPSVAVLDVSMGFVHETELSYRIEDRFAFVVKT